MGPKDPALQAVSPSLIWIEGERLRLQFVGPLEVAFRVAGDAKRRRQKNFPPTHQGADIVGIDGERLFAERVSRIRLLADRPSLP